MTHTLEELAHQRAQPALDSLQKWAAERLQSTPEQERGLEVIAISIALRTMLQFIEEKAPGLKG